MKFTFFGTDKFSVTVLNELEKAGLTPSAVICAPDRPKGRGLVMSAPEVKVWAQARNIVVHQPEKLDETFSSQSDFFEDLFVVASYGKIIPKHVLNIPKHGTLNVHPSLLPKWRGASPVEYQILKDDQDIGVTIMLVDEKMDHGPIVDQEFIEPPYWPMKGSELSQLLAKEGGELLARTIPEWVSGNIDAQEQEHDLATITKKIKKEDGEINLNDDPYQNLLKIRAFDTWPRTFFFHKSKRIVITEADIKDGELEIKRVIPEGKKEQDWQNNSK